MPYNFCVDSWLPSSHPAGAIGVDAIVGKIFDCSCFSKESSMSEGLPRLCYGARYDGVLESTRFVSSRSCYGSSLVCCSFLLPSVGLDRANLSKLLSSNSRVGLSIDIGRSLSADELLHGKDYQCLCLWLKFSILVDLTLSLQVASRRVKNRSDKLVIHGRSIMLAINTVM